ncbi:hypothetical protein HK405_004970, partial [Cladochytrium tenue]
MPSATSATEAGDGNGDVHARAAAETHAPPSPSPPPPPSSASLPLHAAVRRRDPAALSAALLQEASTGARGNPHGGGDSGGGVDAADADGNTALHLAAMAADPALVRALLRAGAALDVQNADGRSPIDYALHSEVEAILVAEHRRRMLSERPRTPSSSSLSVGALLGGERGGLPDDTGVLQDYILEVTGANATFQARCRDAVRQLVEEKHILMSKNRVLEQALGIVDRESGERIVDHLQYWQDEVDRQAATVAYLK